MMEHGVCGWDECLSLMPESSCRALTWVWLAATPLTDGREALRPWVEDAVTFQNVSVTPVFL